MYLYLEPNCFIYAGMHHFAQVFSNWAFCSLFAIAMAGSEETEWLEELLAYNRQVASKHL